MFVSARQEGTIRLEGLSRKIQIISEAKSFSVFSLAMDKKGVTIL